MHKFKEKHIGKYEITIRTALIDDIPNLLLLNQKWYKLNLNSLNNGFLTVVYNNDFFIKAINNDDVLLFENANNKILGYALVNTVMKTEHISNLKKQYAFLRPEMQSKKTAYSFQIILDNELQGTYFIVTAQKAYMKYFKTKYDLLVSTISKENTRSIRIHNKLGIKFFETDNDYLIGELIL